MKKIHATHPKPAKLRGYARGQLNTAETKQIESHVANCDVCGRSIEQLSEDPFVSLIRSATSGEAATPVGQLSHAETISPTMASESGPAGPTTIPLELANHTKYRIIRPLGVGGMGTVYQAEHKMMGRMVALKVINGTLVDRPETIERFQTEVKAAAGLSHRNIVAAFDAEQAGGMHFLVMEYIDGVSLAEVVKKYGKLPIAQACNFIRQAATGLQHAHSNGMVHRDIKPHNLMLTKDGWIKVLDFGLARLACSHQQNTGGLTQTGTIMGTPDYIAPEQANDARSADIRADIYSLGCTLYQLLAGQPPFPGDGLLEKLMAHVEREPQPVTAFRRDVPPQLVQVLRKMMAKNPAKRYQTPANVVKALSPFIKSTAVKQKPPSEKRQAAALREPTLIATPMPKRARLARRQPARSSGRLRWILIVVGVMGFLVTSALAAAVYWITTDTGTLIIETADDNVEVVIKHGGKVVEIVDVKTKKKVTLWSGKYEVELGRGKNKLRLVTPRFTIYRGEKEIVAVVLKGHGNESKPAEELKVTWRKIKTLRPRGAATTIVFAPNGKTLAVASHGAPRVQLIDTSTWKPRSLVEKHTHYVVGLTYSHDGKLLATGGFDHKVMLWNATTGEYVKTLNGHTGPIHEALAFTPDDKYLASGGIDKIVRIWDMKTKEEWGQLRGHERWIQTLTFSPDGKTLVTSSKDGTAKLWDWAAKKVRFTLTKHKGPVTYVAFSPDGTTLASSSTDSSVRLWSLAGPRPTIRHELWHGDGVNPVVFSPDGKVIATGCGTADIKIWDVRTGKELTAIPAGHPSIRSLAFSPDGKLLVAVAGFEVQVYKLTIEKARKKKDTDGNEIRKFVGHQAEVRQVVFSPDGRQALSGSWDNTASLWDVATGKELHRFKAHCGRVETVAFSPDGKWHLTGAGGRAIVWNANTRKQIWNIQIHTDWILGSHFSPDSETILTGSADHTIGLWKTENGNQLLRFAKDVGHKGSVRHVVFSRDGQRALSASFDRTVRLWDLVAKKELLVCEGHTHWVTGVAFSPDNKYALSGSWDKTLRYWDLNSGKELFQLTGHTGRIESVAISPDGRRALSTAHDGTVRLWDLLSRKEICRFDGHTGIVYYGVFSPDGKLALSCGADKTIRLWRLPQNAVPPRSELRIGRWDFRNRLIGQYINQTTPGDCSPWVGVIVNDGRIDGAWLNQQAR